MSYPDKFRFDYLDLLHFISFTVDLFLERVLVTSIRAITSLPASRDLQTNGIVAYVRRDLPAKIVDRVRINELKTILFFYHSF